MTLDPATLAAQALGFVDAETKAVVPPLHTATTYIRDPDNQYRSGRAYSRDDNPSYDQAENLLAALEGVERALYVGDDSTDEDVFRLDEPERVVGVRVGRTSHSAAKWFLGKQAEMDDLLRVLIKARRHKDPHRSV